MHEGWEYVLASYGIAAVTLAIWFWMILAKLRRNRPAGRTDAERVDG